MRTFLLGLTILLASAPASAGSGAVAPGPQDDIDAFMAEVLEQREIDWDQLYNHVFDEVETFRIEGLSRLADLDEGETGVELAALESLRRDYTWYVRDGYLVRSPSRIDGAEVSEADRERAERRWMEQIDAGDRGSRIERDGFFGFEFEPGNYYFAGRESFEGMEVVRVEYYPERLFSDAPDEADERGVDDERADAARRATGEAREASPPGRADDQDEVDYDRMFDKTSLVTMLILPEERQIVSMTFENVGLEFLPMSWLVQVEDLSASLVMHRPYEDSAVWLPRQIVAGARLETAAGPVEFTYRRTFSDYQRTGVEGGVIFGRPIRR